MKLLLIGASGYVGSSLYSKLSQNHEVTGTHYKHSDKHPNLVLLDLNNQKNISDVLRQEAPDVVVHVGGLTSVDYCERNKEEATRLNTDGVRRIIDNFGGKVIYVSTNYVFDGSRGNYTESDPTNPVNHYGLTKARAEEIIIEHPDNLVVRFGSVYGLNPRNNKFFNRFFENGEPKNKIDGSPELMLSPTYLSDVIQNFEQFFEYTGIIHFTSGSPISEYDFFAEISKGLNLGFEVSVRSFDEICKIARRPRNATLSTERDLPFARTSLEDSLRDIHSVLKNP
jgi:dTDP-4-dehydrorhamnose reductase